MKKFLLLSILFFVPLPVLSQEVYRININRTCATIVQIPYASDNFSDEEWKQFQKCLKFMKQFRE